MTYQAKQILFPLLLWPLLAVLSACSGSGIGAIAEGGIGGTGYTEGTISAFGSIFVNGTEYDTGNAEIFINSHSATAEQLQLGMVVRIEGEMNDAGTQGKANKITFDALVQGTVELAQSEGVLVAAKQRILVDSRTVIGGADSFNAIRTGDFVEVSGLSGADGNIIASRVEVKPIAGTPTEKVRGHIQDWDQERLRFRLRDLIVDYSQASRIDVELRENLQVEVRGQQINGVLQAQTILADNPPDLAGNTKIKLKGLITRFAGINDFDVNFRTASITPQTRFKHGGASDLKLNTEVVISACCELNGVLQLDEVEFSGKTNTRSAPGQAFLSAPLDNVNPALLRIGILGITLQLSTSTVLEDKLASPQAQFGLGDLRAGDYVDLSGFVEGVENTFTVEKLRRIPPQKDGSPPLQEVRGPLSGTFSPNGTLRILGIEILSDSHTRYFDGRQPPLKIPPDGHAPPPPRESEINAQMFFDEAARPGTLLSASGHLETNRVRAETLLLLPN